MVVGAAALPVNTVLWDADGTKTLTQDGWTLAGTPSDGLTKSKDFSSGQADAGTNGVWNINDNNVPSNAYMRMWKDTPQGVSGSQGLVMARIRFISAIGSVNGTFGYSSATKDQSVVMCIRDGQINWKTAEQGSISGASAVSVATNVYRVYAIRWKPDGTFDSWYSITNDWSSNPADWVQVVTSAVIPATALIDHTNTKRTGLFLGANGSSSNTWNGNVDWIAWSKNSDYQLPWTPGIIPEPSGLLALASGIVGLAGFCIRRRRR